MRQAFAACVALAVLMVIVIARCGFNDSSPEPPPIADAGSVGPSIDATVAVLDAALPASKTEPKRIRTRPAPKPKPAPAKPKPAPPAPVIPTPAIPPPVIPTPADKPRCTHPPNPAGCPTREPNVNRPCDAEGVHCVYGASCCPFVYVCTGGAFEAQFTQCP